MNKPTHALVVDINSDDFIPGDEPHVRLFNSLAEAERYAVAKLVQAERYAPAENGRFHSRGLPVRWCASMEEVLFDYDIQYLKSTERLQVVPIRYNSTEPKP